MTTNTAISGSSGNSRLAKPTMGRVQPNPAAAEPHQLPALPQRVLASRAFNECMDRLYWAFRDNGGEITRGRFYQICRAYGVESHYAQVVLEAADLCVERCEPRRSNSDRFIWRPCNA